MVCSKYFCFLFAYIAIIVRYLQFCMHFPNSVFMLLLVILQIYVCQINTLLHSLDIDNRMRGPMHGQYPELEQYWNQSQSSMGPASMHNAADKWITEFGNQNNNPESWANSFEQQYGPNGWASEFEQVRFFSMLV